MQSSRQSMVETLAGTAIGFVVSVLLWEFVVKPVWHLETSLVSNLTITLLFTTVSIARSYVVRRFFNHVNKKNSKAHENTTYRDYRNC